MKQFDLGQKVKVEKYYRRNGRKPTQGNRNLNRYTLEDINKDGVWCGKRRIYTKGFSAYEGYEEGYSFMPVESEWVHLVAISPIQQIYVPDSEITG